VENHKKSTLLYNSIDESHIFDCYVKKGHRSMMNATFYAKSSELEQQFLDYCTKKGIVGIKGYRLKGGFRASLYNSMPLGHVERLAEVMKEFEERV
ncbi:MAG: 3-phosphoserine/phosphohydroxythreonine transaminase, partial [Chitinophagales bacterium]